MPKKINYKPLAEKFALFCDKKPHRIQEIHEHLGTKTASHKLVAAAGSLGWAVHYHKPSCFCPFGMYETWRIK